MAIHTTQMMMLQPVKNNRVNQSISDATLRFRVGKAKAASAAIGGRLSIRLRSAVGVVKAAITGTATNHSGRAT